jgi:hypothetical protein
MSSWRGTGAVFAEGRAAGVSGRALVLISAGITGLAFTGVVAGLAPADGGEAEPTSGSSCGRMSRGFKSSSSSFQSSSRLHGETHFGGLRGGAEGSSRRGFMGLQINRRHQGVTRQLDQQVKKTSGQTQAFVQGSWDRHLRQRRSLRKGSQSWRGMSWGKPPATPKSSGLRPRGM